MPITDAKDVAQQILTQLGAGFTMPTINLNDPAFNLPSTTNNPLYGAVPTIEIDDLTTRTVEGTGVFDKLMTAHKVHLKEQYERGLITGDQYTKAYIELTSLAMSTALQFLLQKDQTYWNAILVQSQARKAEIEAIQASIALQTAKIQLVMMQSQASEAEARYVLTLMQVAAQDAQYELAHKQIDYTQGQIDLQLIQEKMTEEQFETQRAQTLDTRSDGTPITGLVGAQKLLVQKQVDTADFQKVLVQEQAEAQRGQTLDTRLDGVTPVTGLLGKQKDLYTQQIDSYKKDAEHKVAKMYLDSWITQKTLDDAYPFPPQLDNINVEAVLLGARTSVGL